METLPLVHIKGRNESEIKMVQVKRDAYKALYERHVAGSFRGYEMFKVRVQKPLTTTFGGVEVEHVEKELFPNDEMFGKDAWSLLGASEQEAIKRFDAYDAVTKRKRGRKPKNVAYGIKDDEE
jgi:hypothetical protein